MRTHINNTELCRKGCATLFSILKDCKIEMTNKHRFNNNNSFYTANNKMRMDAMSAINDILKVMNRHINNPDVCEHGCDILMCMSVDNGNKNAITCLCCPIIK